MYHLNSEAGLPPTLPRDRKFFPSVLRYEPNTKGELAPYNWQKALCQQNYPAAKMLHLFIMVANGNAAKKRGEWMRWTAGQLVARVGIGKSEKTMRRALHLLEKLEVVEIGHERKFHRNGMPDRAFQVRLQTEVIDRWLINEGYAGDVIGEAMRESLVSSMPPRCRMVAGVADTEENEPPTEDEPSGIQTTHTLCSLRKKKTPCPSGEGNRNSFPGRRKKQTISRNLSWIVGTPVPDDRTLRDFAAHRWCAAVVHLLGITVVTQPEARAFLCAIRGRRFTVDHMLYIQCVMAAREDVCWQKGLKALLERVASEFQPRPDDENMGEFHLGNALDAQFCRELDAAYRRSRLRDVREAAILAAARPVDETEDMECWASSWRDYASLLKGSTGQYYTSSHAIEYMLK